MKLNHALLFALTATSPQAFAQAEEKPAQPTTASSQAQVESPKQPKTAEVDKDTEANDAPDASGTENASTVAPAGDSAESSEEGAAAATEEAPAAETPIEDAGASAESEAAPEAAPEPEEEAAPAPINPRPESDAVRLTKHPLDAEASYFKPGTGLVLESKDGMFSIAPRLRVQFRDEVEIGEEATTNVFGIRRARIQFKGHIFDKNVKYKAEFAFSPKDLGMKDGVPHHTPLLSWYTDFTHLRDLSLRLGQYKLLYSRQRVVSSGDQEFVDRTTAQNEFNLDRDIGGHFFSDDLFGLGLFKYYTGFSIAEGRDSWEEETTSGGGTSGSWQYLARLEVLPFGDFNDYSEVDFDRENKVRLSVGAAYAHTENATKDKGYQGSSFTDGGTVDYENLTLDAMLKWAGMTAFAEYFYRNGQRGSAALDPAAAGPDDVFLTRDGMGGSVQVGYLLPRLPIGIGARYSALGRGPFEETESSVTDEHEAGGTVGYYFAGHNLKLQGDYFHLWSDEAEAKADRFRVQLQVAY